MQNIDPSKTKAWAKLTEHFSHIKDVEMKNLFAEDSNRAQDLTINWEDFLVDFSKNRITAETKQLLTDLAVECELEEAIASYFGGEVINRTEQRPVLHTALRTVEDEEVLVKGENVMPEVYSVKAKMESFCDAIID